MTNPLGIILGNQLFPLQQVKALPCKRFFMAESEELYKYFSPHKQKVAHCFAAMRSYRNELEQAGFEVFYIGAGSEQSQIPFTLALETVVDDLGADHVHMFEIEDKFFERRILDWAKDQDIAVQFQPSPMFIANRDDFKSYLKSSKRPFMKTFYESQRRKTGLMMTGDEPEGGQFSYDTENRKKLPSSYSPPRHWQRSEGPHDEAVIDFISKSLDAHPGTLHTLLWPTTRKESLKLLDHFIKLKLEGFGPYQDAIDPSDPYHYHSLISVALNTGLLLPQEVCDRVAKAKAPLASREGFIRQVLGWREFVRGIYQNYESKLYEGNHWNHKRKLGPAWYCGDLGIPPVDDAIKKALDTGYCHHIERLMILANIMNLCQIDPKDVYRWFMEMFIDSSDWVMAANVFGMGLMSDGGIFATKPYISGSNYILKMSHYKKGPWCDIWDGLYWQFIDRHQDYLSKNARMGFMVKQLGRISDDRKKTIYSAADHFLKDLDKGS
ncbi:cryptochrome/photolyase family protein [Pseudobacteriovorax antillogorgiicola]|uniref:Deoxyribodipyrimidine photolyase-related protein n=1 Tax=Pseudobacteriovorax antillogorgiicola TaxID=1513793 RepID=A0A1Y6CA56_9BACT|nr:cryptochrome/photolyase family protein [Pseudobacteriovorax antillogorgiicola]TCS49768.1 deoxyribodipyrimidine photolyase-related protein [Pseudobacteriovorax antillogorgiicola]SMF42714.1 deoxyribodipyrimidine photolyase-related protein [Pseudobacteriovorax antillogorgiicola]